MAILWVAMSFSDAPLKDPGNQLTLTLRHFVGNELLKLDSATYKNDIGQTFTISKFRYYIGNIHLKNNNGKDVVSNETFLIDEDEADSKKISLKNIPPGNYASIDFIIGVDSVHNCSGAQSGALDPVNGMFWAWNTGYIFLKLEGKARASGSPGNFFEYHIGGYKQPSNCIRKVIIPVANGLIIERSKDQQLNIKADILEILKTPNTIDFEKLSSVVDAKNATLIADNYSDLFSLL